MTVTRVFQSALGIQTGDIVRTEFGPDRMYSSGPYEVWSITGPQYVTGWIDPSTMHGIVVRDYPVIHLSCIRPGSYQHDMYSLHWYRHEGDRYLDDGGGELFIVERATLPVQGNLFNGQATTPEPYAFEPDVTYQGEMPAWKCGYCGRDFNAPRRKSGGVVTYPPACIHCGRYCCEQIHFQSRLELTS